MASPQTKTMTFLLILAGSLVNVGIWLVRLPNLDRHQESSFRISAERVRRLLHSGAEKLHLGADQANFSGVDAGSTTETSATKRGGKNLLSRRASVGTKAPSQQATKPPSECYIHETAVVGFLPGCIADDCKLWTSFESAKTSCLADESCGGITAMGEQHFELRESNNVEPSPAGEQSFAKICPEREPPTPPEEWEVPASVQEDFDSVGSYVDGEPTIFVSIASYRDELCHVTLEGALTRATHPKRLFFGVVEQNLPDSGDLPCDYKSDSCRRHPEQMICLYADQIRIHHVDSRDATGPTFGRFRADRLYRGEYFALQVDGHTYFGNGWDTDVIKQWNATANEYAVLTTYPSDASVIDKQGKVRSRSSPVICDSRLLGNGMLKHEAATEIYPRFGNTPILHPLWGAGMSFSRGHRILRVPYDCCLPMIFDGEEFSMAVRMWTHGYDFYTPHHAVLAHPYNRPRPPPNFLSSKGRGRNRNSGQQGRSARRIQALLGLEPTGGYDETEVHPDQKYGLGTRRPLSTYMKLFGYDLKQRKIRGNCLWAESQQLHSDLVQYLRKDGKGIDYTLVPVERLNSERGREKKSYR